MTTNVDELRVRDLMSKGVATLEQNDTLTTADQVMRLGRIRHMPVVDGEGQLVGVVSQRDLFRSALMRALGYGSRVEDRVLEALRVKDAMTTDVATASPELPLREAAQLMMQRKIGCLVVLEEGEPIGILTEGDFVALATRDG
jgi:CBS domain-containing protein